MLDHDCARMIACGRVIVYHGVRWLSCVEPWDCADWCYEECLIFVNPNCHHLCRSLGLDAVVGNPLDIHNSNWNLLSSP